MTSLPSVKPPMDSNASFFQERRTIPGFVCGLGTRLRPGRRPSSVSLWGLPRLSREELRGFITTCSALGKALGAARVPGSWPIQPPCRSHVGGVIPTRLRQVESATRSILYRFPKSWSCIPPVWMLGDVWKLSLAPRWVWSSST